MSEYEWEQKMRELFGSDDDEYDDDDRESVVDTYGNYRYKSR